MEEDLGADYFNDLLSRCFFQPSSDSKSEFIMHDLINDLAQEVATEICFNFKNIHKVSQGLIIYHLCMVSMMCSKNLKSSIN